LAVTWTGKYPSAERLLQEIDALIECFVEALLGHVPADEIAGIYVKGSAIKPWDSPIDYVPELSDVDIHLLFRDAEDIARRFDLQAALGMRSEIVHAYSARVSAPIHFPEPQLVVLNRLLAQPDYCPSPEETLKTVFGEPLCEKRPDPERVRDLDRKSVLALAPRVEALPLRMIDKPAAHLPAVLRDLNWQLSPTGPRVLTMMGVPPQQAWSANRTRVCARLEQLGEVKFAEDYARYYLAGWDYFLSGYTDSSAAEAAVEAFDGAMRRGLEIAAREV
jgi:hypothetical protein